MSPTAARKIAAQMTLTPGTVISRLICGELQGLLGDQPLDLLDLLIEELDVAQAGLDGLILDVWQFQSPQPVPAFDPEQVRHRRAALQAAHQHGVQLVLDPGARAYELVAASEAPAHAGDPLGWHPHRLKLAGPQQLGQRARIEPVGLRARLTDAGIARERRR